MYMAIPPLLPLGRRSSTKLYPASSGGNAAAVVQVSYIHSMSTSICASIIYSLR